MQRFLTLFSVFFLALLLVPLEARAQPVPSLTVNGVEGDITLNTSEYVSVETSEGARIRLFLGADCLTATAAEPVVSYYYFQVVPITQSYQAHWITDETVVSPCRTVTWIEPDMSAPPSLTIDGVAGNVSAIIGHTFSIVTHPDATVDVYPDSTVCSGTPASSVLGGAASHSTEARSYAYQARWPGTTGPVSACLTATWQLPPRTDPPPLTLNGGTKNVNVVGMESFKFLTDSNAEMDVYQALDCSGTPVFTQPHQWEGVSRPYNHYSVQAFWPESPELRSECLTVEILHPVPPLSVNGSTSNLSLEAGETATFLTDPLAEISLFESADCSGSPTSTTTETVAETLSTDGVVSAQSNWIDDAEPVSPCLVVTWADSTTPLPTATSEPATTPTPDPSATQPSATVAPDPNAPGPNDAGSNNSLPNDPPASSTTQGASVVTSLPSAGSGSGSSVVIATVAVLMSVIVLAIGALRSRRA